MIVFTLLVWAVTLAKLPATWANRHSPATRSYWLALFSLAACMTLDQPAVYVALGERTGAANIAFPLILTAGINAAIWCQRFLRFSHGERTGGRLRHGAAAAMILVLWVTYLPAFSHLPNTHDTEHGYPEGAWQLVFRFTLAAWSAFALADIALMLARFSRQADSRPLRFGTATAAFGAVLVAGRMVGEYLPLTLKMWLAGPSPSDHAWIRAVNLGALAGFALMALGLGLPALARRLASAEAWGTDLVHHLQLRHLWRTVRPAVPTLAWPRYRVPWLHQLPGVAVRGQLYRRVVEIQDGFLALDPYRAEDGGPWPAGRREQAAADALAVSAAAGRFAAGSPAGAGPAAGADPARLDDVSYLVLVSRYLRGAASGG